MVCAFDAITFQRRRLPLVGVGTPGTCSVDPARCYGCGSCTDVCPVNLTEVEVDGDIVPFIDCLGHLSRAPQIAGLVIDIVLTSHFGDVQAEAEHSASRDRARHVATAVRAVHDNLYRHVFLAVVLVEDATAWR